MPKPYGTEVASLCRVKITYGLAQLIVSQTIDLLGTNVSVTGDDGMIIASGDSGHVGSFHPVAARALQLGEPVEVTGEEAAQHQIAREGICLPLTYDGRRVGAIIVNDAVKRCRASSRVVQALAELLIHQNTVLEQLPLQKELRDKFIYDLLHNVRGEEDAVLRQAQVLGMDLSVPRVVILVDASEFILNGWQGDGASPVLERQLHIRRNKHRIVQTVVSFFNLPTDAICGYVGDGRIAVLKSVGGDDPPSWGDLAAFKETARMLLLALKRETNTRINLGVGRYHPGLAGLAKSYQDAAVAVELGSRLIGSNQVHCLDSLGTAALVGPADKQTKVELATHLLKPLDDQPELLQTLQVFFEEDLSPSQAAERLYVHRNTLGYRLDKIHTITGLDPRRFDQAVQLRLALVLRSLA